MNSFINRQGISSGPLRITSLKDESYSGTWLVSDGNALLVGSDWKLNSNNSIPYSTLLATTGLSSTDPRFENMVVTVKWIRENVSGAGGAGGVSSPVSEASFNQFKTVVLGNNTSYTTPSILSVAQNASAQSSQAITRLNALDAETDLLRNEIAELSTNLDNHIEDFDNHVDNFDSYKTNPYPDGVIFIGGGANNA